MKLRKLIILLVLLVQLVFTVNPAMAYTEYSYTKAYSYSFVVNGQTAWKHQVWWYYTWRSGDGWVKTTNAPIQRMTIYDPSWHVETSGGGAGYNYYASSGSGAVYYNMRQTGTNFCYRSTATVVVWADLTPPNWDPGHDFYNCP